MSRSSWLFERMRGWSDQESLVGDWGSINFGGLLEQMEAWSITLDDAGITPGRVVAFAGDYCGKTVALLLALIERDCIAVPLSRAGEEQTEDLLRITCADAVIDVSGNGTAAITRRVVGSRHPLIETLASEGRPGLVLFSSGSTGRAKAMLHDFSRLLERYETRREGCRILSFLLLDHIGGINTLFHGLAHGGTVVNISERRTEAVCRAIERHRVEVLPTTPSFLNLLLLSGDQHRYDLSSLRLITYGTEVMPEGTLERSRQAFGNVRFQQTYGLSELGILRTKSREDGSVWVKVGGEGYETRIVDGLLWVRARSAVLGYLNAPSPFLEDGWFNTGDRVDVDGEYIRFLGRASELINVAGLKVYPAEVENELAQMDNVAEVSVYGEPNTIVGHLVCARIKTIKPESPRELMKRILIHCRGRLESYKIPTKVELSDQSLLTVRCKLQRPTPTNQL